VRGKCPVSRSPATSGSGKGHYKSDWPSPEAHAATTVNGKSEDESTWLSSRRCVGDMGTRCKWDMGMWEMWVPWNVRCMEVWACGMWAHGMWVHGMCGAWNCARGIGGDMECGHVGMWACINVAHGR